MQNSQRVTPTLSNVHYQLQPKPIQALNLTRIKIYYHIPTPNPEKELHLFSSNRWILYYIQFNVLSVPDLPVLDLPMQALKVVGLISESLNFL